MATVSEPPKPLEKKYRCRACQTLWTKEQLINGVCGDAACQGSVDLVKNG